MSENITRQEYWSVAISALLLGILFIFSGIIFAYPHESIIAYIGESVAETAYMLGIAIVIIGIIIFGFGAFLMLFVKPEFL